jgi:glycosyltransferase involved in cell wall biosynthesis
MRICFVLTAPFALNAFVAPAIRSLLAKGWQVTAVVDAGSGAIAEDIAPKIEIVDLKIARAISPLQDLHALWALLQLFRSREFDIVHSVTPKAGLLAMMGARLAGVSVRIHTFTGQVWATRRGPIRWLLRALDRFLAKCASALLVDSASQREFLMSQGIASSERLTVLGSGSICGVDTNRFRPMPQERDRVRTALGLAADAVLLLYVGRMHPEKGLTELTQAFSKVAALFPDAHLLMIGPDEGGLQPALDASADSSRARIHVVGLTNEPERYMAAADIFCLPSYREGFGLSLIEAASVGLPCAATRIYGLTDAVVDGVTGLLVTPRSVEALAQALEIFLSKPSLRAEMGRAARQRVEKDFSQQILVEAWLSFYEYQLSQSSTKV